MTAEERPLNRSDYERVYGLLMAYRLKAIDGDDAPFWEILHHVHSDTLEGEPVPLDSLIGEAGPAREDAHARLVLDALLRGKTTIRDSGRAPLTVCGTPGCPELTHGRLCPSCELAEGLDGN
ncbi:hypothetical protein PV350_35380 [Streptomyces sp. PA03-6a]|nr:hypothetical protein [Streptomyces sp. PA03-6a]